MKHLPAPALLQGEFILILTCSLILGCFMQLEFSEKLRAKEGTDGFYSFYPVLVVTLDDSLSPLLHTLLTCF